MLEIKDLVFVHDFSKDKLLVEQGESIKDRYSEAELKTVCWPVSLAGGASNRDFQNMPFAVLRPVRNPQFMAQHI